MLDKLIVPQRKLASNHFANAKSQKALGERVVQTTTEHHGNALARSRLREEAVNLDVDPCEGVAHKL